KHVIAAVDVTMAPGSKAARYLAAYRKWMGLPADRSASHFKWSTESPARGGGTLDTGVPGELVILSVGRTTAHCRAPGGGEVTLPANSFRGLAPGQTVTVRSGAVESVRIDVG